MKQFTLLLFVVALAVSSCVKQSSTPVRSYYDAVQRQLSDSLPGNAYATIDFSRAVHTTFKDGRRYLRIGFNHSKLVNDFVLLSINEDGQILKGRIVHLEAEFAFPGLYNGFVLIKNLQGDVLVSAPVAEGYVQRTSILARSQSMLDPYKELPEVVVISHYASDTDYSFGSYYNLFAIMGDFGGGGSGGNQYSNADPFIFGGGGGGYTGGPVLPSPGSAPIEEEPLELEPEYVYSLDAIDIKKFFNCFDLVPSAGATYSIQLSADIPINNNPGASTPFNVGHSFITVVKKNGTASVTQSFGFYPKETPSKTEFLSPMPSELKDNKEQEINASISMLLTENQFQLMKFKAIAQSTKSYDLANYNCTNYALDVFNAARSSPITVAGHTVYLPGNPITIHQSPQALFTKLRDMQKQGHAEAANIKIDLSHNYNAPISKGECN